MGRSPITFILVLAALFAATACAPWVTQEDPDRPNIVLILTDDMRKDDLEHMPKTQNLIVDQGVEYSNAFVTTSSCCPSRASILRGQYVHNHRVRTNVPPKGGFDKFQSLGHESSNIATWLHNAGYKTVLIGKYLNGYDDEHDAEHVPPDWDEWYAKAQPGTLYYDYKLSENGTVVSYGSREQDYLTDVQTEKAKDFIRRTAGDSQPLFMYLAPSAPHGPLVSAPRHDHMFEGKLAPRPPSFNEKDVSDKPTWVRDLPRLSFAEKKGVDRTHQRRLRMLQAVDDMVEGVVNELSAAGRLDNTYLFFASDNGFLLGEHRIAREKQAPYEESIRVPLAVRGPGIPAGRVSDQIALNIDIAPTFADLGGATTPSFVDGRSLRPTFTSKAPSWRTAFLEEFWGESPRRPGESPKYKAVRTSRYKFVHYPITGDHELYNLNRDPYELESRHETADPTLTETLQSRLKALKGCAGESCPEAENGP